MVTAAAAGVGCGSGQLTESDVEETLGGLDYSVQYVETDYGGPGELVAAEVKEGSNQVRTLVFSGEDPRGIKQSAPWPDYEGSAVGLGEDGDNDLFVWTETTVNGRERGDLKPEDYDVAVAVEDALCARRLDEETCPYP
jgi:hypothetical protein